ncbi:MAG: CoA transferase [Acidimicrobiales bacterium]
MMLSHYRVLDLSDDRGLLGGHILAQLGADVIHVEPPSAAGEPRSTTRLAYTRGARSVMLDLDDPADRARFHQLVASADALIESADPGTWEARGLGYDALSGVNPRLVWTSITAFGPDGPKAGYAATDLIVQAASGAMDLAGPLDRPPLRTAAITAYAHAGAEAAGGTLIALAEARRSGRGQRVDVSAQRAKNLTAFFTVPAAEVGHSRLYRTGSGFRMVGVEFPFVWPCADGFVSLTVALDAGNMPFLTRLLSWMAEEGAVDPDLVSMDWRAHVKSIRSGDIPNTDLQRLSDSIGAFIASHTKADLMAAALDRRLLLVPVATIGDLLHSPQLDTREFWRRETLPDGREVELPAHLVKGASPTPAGPAPAPGQHTTEILAEVSGPSPAGGDGAPTEMGEARRAASSRREPGASPRKALAGLKVLDMMWIMAGPTSTGVLAQYGATVVRVENAGRIDTVRLLPPYFGGKAGRETSFAFGSINAGKLSVTLDPNIPEARDVIRDLVRWADVVTESFSPKAMAAWGLDYASLRRIKPDLIMISSCLFGQTGPYALVAGYGTMGAAIGGMVQPTGWPDQPPAGPYGAYTDACAPRISVAAILAAVEHRDRTGEGTYLDQSQIEASLHYMTPAILDHQITGNPWDRMGNDDPELCPHGVYPSAGDNEWVAIAVRSVDDWRALATAIGRDDLAADPALGTAEGRRARQAELDAAIAAWTADRPPGDAEAVLQARSVPAHAVVHSHMDELDPQLVHRQHLVPVLHEGQPERVVERTRIELSRTPPDPHHIPAMGQHTDQILRDVLGYDEARVAQLRACGALGSEPRRT